MANGGQRFKDYITEEVGFPDKALIIEEGCKFHSVYVILEGQVKVVKKTQKASIVLETLKEGATIGEMCLLLQDTGASKASVLADGAVRLGALDTDKILAEYQGLAEDSRELLNGIMTSLYQANQFLANVSAPAD
jgi:CRP-like cAMP-binding protein